MAQAAPLVQSFGSHQCSTAFRAASPTASATTCAAPIARRARAHAEAVAPVVITSSTSRIRFPEKSGARLSSGLAGANSPSEFAIRPAPTYVDARALAANLGIETMIKLFRRVARMRGVIRRNLSLLDGKMHNGRDTIHITHCIDVGLRRAHGTIDDNSFSVSSHTRQIEAKPLEYMTPFVSRSMTSAVASHAHPQPGISMRLTSRSRTA